MASNFKECIKCVSLNNGSSHARITLVNSNSNESLYYPYTVSVNKCGGSCNTTKDPYALVSVPDKVKNVTI